MCIRDSFKCLKIFIAGGIFCSPTWNHYTCNHINFIESHFAFEISMYLIIKPYHTIKGRSQKKKKKVQKKIKQPCREGLTFMLYFWFTKSFDHWPFVNYQIMNNKCKLCLYAIPNKLEQAVDKEFIWSERIRYIDITWNNLQIANMIEVISRNTCLFDQKKY